MICAACPLRARPDFRAVAPADLAWIEAQRHAQSQLPAGAIIRTEGEGSDQLQTLFAGWGFRFKTLPDGRRQILNFLLPGDLIGLQADLLAVAAHGVEALTPVILCEFRRETVWALYRDHPALAYDVTFLAAHSERLGDDILLSVGRRDAVERLAALLVQLYRRASSAGLENDGSIAFPPTQAHLADALGLSTVHVNRVLQRLRRDGLVRLEAGRLAIGDLRALRRVAEYWEQPAPPRPLI